MGARSIGEVGMPRKLIAPVLVILALVAGVMVYLVLRGPTADVAEAADATPASITASPPLSPAPTGPAPALPESNVRPDYRLYFIGNSFTYVNDLPAMVRALAAANGLRVEVEGHTPPGATLAQQAANPDVRNALTKRWSYVVIQEQSQLPSFEDQRRDATEPNLRRLMELAKVGGSPTVLFETWGYKNGDGDTYVAMQSRLDDGFAKLIAATNIQGIPVNKAWRRAHAEHPEIELWSPDGRHPAVAGTYLAACVFYERVVHRAVKGNSYTAGLPADVATTLQGIATSN